MNKTDKNLIVLTIIIAAAFGAVYWFYPSGAPITPPAEGFILPIQWGNLGVQMVAAGVVDRADLNDLNLLWALGLGNKNEILEKGPMMDSRYGGAGNFASTGGWTLAKGDAMEHYSKHSFITLTPEQQVLIEKVSKNIYRPCCDNSTYFPDCNHGMAMLGLLELLASQGASEPEMYKAAFEMNSLWFPEQYATIARYLESKGRTLSMADPKEILGKDYSSASGYQNILSQITSPATQSGAGCSL